MPSGRRPDTEHQTGPGIQGCRHPVPVAQHCKILQCKGRKSGETAAKSYHEKGPQLRPHPSVPVEKSVQHSDGEASEQVDGQRPVRKRRRGTSLYPTGQQVTGDASQATAHADED